MIQQEHKIVQKCPCRTSQRQKMARIDWFWPRPEINRQLYDKYALSAPERHFIESMIKPMG